MENYDLIKMELDNILNNNEFISNKEYISAYDLKYILYNEFKEIYNTFNNRKKVIENINIKNRNIIKKILKIDKEERLYAIHLYTNEKNNTQELNFIFIYYDINCNSRCFTICKNKQNDILFFKKDKEKTEQNINFVEKNIEYITTILNQMEYYNIKYNVIFNCQKLISPNINQTFKYNIFNLHFDFSKEPSTIITLENPKLNETLTKQWLSKENLNNYINRNIDELLKRIPISINQLNPLYKQIVLSSLIKEKTLQLKIKSYK